MNWRLSRSVSDCWVLPTYRFYSLLVRLAQPAWVRATTMTSQNKALVHAEWRTPVGCAGWMDMSGCPAHPICNHTKAAGDGSHEHAFYKFSSYDVSRPLNIRAAIVWIVVSIQVSYRKSQSTSIKRIQKGSALLEVLRECVSHSFPSTTGIHCFRPLWRTQQ